MDTARQIDVRLSTADADSVVIDYDGCDLKLSFVDWREQRQSCVFSETLSFFWQPGISSTDLRNDTTYVIDDSSWLSQQVSLVDEQTQHYTHYKFCFNEVGVLDVVCRAFSAASVPSVVNKS